MPSTSARGVSERHGMGGGSLAPQRVIDQRGDSRPVLGAGEAPRQAPVLQRHRRPAGGARSMSCSTSMAALIRAAGVMGFDSCRPCRVWRPRGWMNCAFDRFEHDAGTWRPPRHALDAVVSQAARRCNRMPRPPRYPSMKSVSRIVILSLFAFGLAACATQAQPGPHAATVEAPGRQDLARESPLRRRRGHAPGSASSLHENSFPAGCCIRLPARTVPATCPTPASCGRFHMKARVKRLPAAIFMAMS